MVRRRVVLYESRRGILSITVSIKICETSGGSAGVKEGGRGSAIDRRYDQLGFSLREPFFFFVQRSCCSMEGVYSTVHKW